MQHDRKPWRYLGVFPLALALAGTCLAAPLEPPRPPAEDRIQALVAEHGIVTLGAGILKDGKLVWQGHWGEETPGVPASAQTRFNIASITKTVTAETVLRLVAKGRLSLDDAMADWWLDPDIADDPRQKLLTPRLALTHATGFPNWRFFRDDYTLAFEREPGSYGYSGEGILYLARYAEQKLGQNFADLVAETVFQPLGMTSAQIVARYDQVDHIARPVDEAGTFPGYYCRVVPKGMCRKEGSWSASGDMVITVADYAAFMGAVMRADGYGPALAAERDTVFVDRGGANVVLCDQPGGSPCPDKQGYGLGFNILKYGDVTVVGHTGSDWAELSVAYFYEPTGDGLILFLNAPNRRALEAMPGLLSTLDPQSPYLQQFDRSLARAKAQDKP